ncbi:MAG TPA: hypothetical protein VGN04_04800 [Herbaspirillum sp.]|jgi:hypothetical protein
MTTSSIRLAPYNAATLAGSQKAGNRIDRDLSDWVGRGPNAGQRVRRGDALEKIKACFANPSETLLDLSKLGLTEAPPHFPATVKTIDLSGNRLKQFSTPLHDGMEELNLSGNVLTEIETPMPEGLRRLNISYNHLSSVPACPHSLDSLKAARNLFDELPHDLHSYLVTDFKPGNYARGAYYPVVFGKSAAGADQRSNAFAKFRPKDAAKKAVSIEAAPSKTVSQTNSPMPAHVAPHTRQKIAAAPGFAMDSRFGRFGYARENPDTFKSYQMPLTKRGGDDARGNAAPYLVELLDTGYAAHIEYADGHHQPIIPGAMPDIVHTAEEIHGNGFSLPLPPVIPAKIMHLPQSEGGADFVMFELSEFNPNDGSTVRNTHYLPFSTYQQPDETIIGMVSCNNDSTAYCFNVDAAGIPLTEKNGHVTLTLATQDQADCMLQLQSNLHVESNRPCPILSRAGQLKDETIEVKAKFEKVFERNRAMLDRAIEAHRRFPVRVERTLAKLVGLRPGTPKLRSMLKTISAGWESMRDALPHLQSQSPYAVGFFDIKELPTLTGQARNLSLKTPLHLQHLKNPLIALSRPLFMDDSIPLDALASVFRHELSHALQGTSDNMNPQIMMQVYPNEDTKLKKVFLAPVEKAAALPGSEPENHAATLEVFTELCSYLADERTKHLTLDYLKPGSHSFKRDVGGSFSGLRAAGKPPAAARRPARSSAPITSAPLRSLYQPK